MNIVLVSDKRFKKKFEATIQNTPDVILLGSEVVVKNGFVTKISEDYNPHAIMIVRGVQLKDNIDIRDMISLLHLKRPAMRIIYVYGDVKDEKDFKKMSEFLIENNVYDIVSGQKTEEEFSDILQNPMTLDKLIEAEKSEEVVEEIVEETSAVTAKIIDTTQVEMNKEAFIAHQFDIMEVTTINETNEEVTEVTNITVGIAELLHHNGCTHTSFEMATMLTKRGKSVCVVISDDYTYSELTNYYGIDPNLADVGFELKNRINIFPYSKLDVVKKEYNYIICDFGYLREEHQEAFSDTLIKIMLCSSAEWDVTTLMNYINGSGYDYVKEINYCFYPISQPKFLSYNKQLIKGHCKAYRLTTSTDWLSPCEENSQVYLNILKHYTNIVPAQIKQEKKVVKKKA